MSAAAARRVGWCPGALRPMASGDGLIVRVRPRGGTLVPDVAHGIAAAAVRHGSGAIDLTARANLQIRGVRERALPDLVADLGHLGLLDPDPASEARRNVIASPLAGLDPSAAFDTRPAVAVLEDVLVAAEDLRGLPDKFGVVVSDGGAMPLRGVTADLRFDALRDPSGACRFALRLGGRDDVAATVAAAAIGETAVAVAAVFLAAHRRDPGLRRMRDLVADRGAAEVLSDAGLRPRGVAPLRTGAAVAPVGVLDLPVIAPDGRIAAVLGLASPFGRLAATSLTTLAEGAARAGLRELRLTPWRSILLAGLAASEAARLALAGVAAGFIVDSRDPRLRVAACTGAPGCGRATTAVLDDATHWAATLAPAEEQRGIVLHVSGCAKGCAHPGAAPWTVVAEAGRYGLVVDGSAAEAPSVAGLDAEEMRQLLRTNFGGDRRP